MCLMGLVGYFVLIFWLGLMVLVLFYVWLGWVGGFGCINVGFFYSVELCIGFMLVDCLLVGDWEVL